MKAFNELENQDLRWVQKSAWKREYELQTGDGETVAHIVRPSWWNSKALVESVGNRWEFERKGFWQQYIEIRSVGTGEEPARYYYNGKRLEFPDGREYHWRSNVWGSKWTWVTPNGDPVVGFQTGGVFRTNAEIHLDPDIAGMKALPLLVFLGWYLILLAQEDSAAGAVVIAT